jgi:hypothetical protein
MRFVAQFGMVLLALVTTAVAVNANEPVFVDPEFHFDDIDVLYVLPAVDLRQQLDKHSEEDLEILDLTARCYVQRRGYHVEPKDRTPRLAPCTAVRGSKAWKPYHKSPPTRLHPAASELNSPQPSFIRTLGPDKARWVLLLVLVDASTHMKGVRIGRAQVAGMLFDKQRGKLVWHGIGNSGPTLGVTPGVVVGALMKHMNVQDAIQDATLDLSKMFDKQKRK